IDRTLARGFSASSPTCGGLAISHEGGSGPVILHNSRFTLIPVTSESTPFLYGLATMPEVGYRWRFRGAFPNVEAFQANLWKGVLTQFVAVHTPSREPAGHLVAYNADLGRGYAYIGAAFTPEYLRTGLPVDAVDLFVRYIFQIWSVRKLYME